MPRKAEPLTNRTIERIKPVNTAIRLAVGGVPGLMLSVQPSGSRTFYLTWRGIDGKVIWHRLGDFDPEAFAVEAARSRAAELKTSIAAGQDPRVDRARSRKQAADELEAIKKAASRPRWEGLLDLYVAHVTANGKPRTIAWAVDLLENHLDGTFRKRNAQDVTLYPPEKISRRRRNMTPGAAAGFLAGRFVDEIEPRELITLHRAIKDSGGVTADRCIAILRKAYSLAVVEGWCVSNPAMRLGIKHSGAPRSTFLDAGQLAALGKVLEEVEAAALVPWQATAAIRLLLATGLRKSEVLALTWREVDLERGQIRLTDHKTSVKTGDLVQPLSDDALEILRAIAARPGAKLSLYALPGELDHRKPFANLTKHWGAIRARAGLGDVHLHDLRRTFASWAALTGVDLATASKLLNHSNVAVTAKVYAQASLEAKRDASDKIAGAIGAAMRGAR